MAGFYLKKIIFPATYIVNFYLVSCDLAIFFSDSALVGKLYLLLFFHKQIQRLPNFSRLHLLA